MKHLVNHTYFILLILTFNCLRLNAQANKDYKQVKDSNVKKIIFFEINQLDTNRKFVCEYDKDGFIRQYKVLEKRRGKFVPILNKVYYSECRGGLDCRLYTEERYFSKGLNKKYNFSRINIQESKYEGHGKKRSLLAKRYFEQEVDDMDSSINGDNNYAYLCYLYSQFIDEIHMDRNEFFKQNKLKSNYSVVLLYNTDLFV